VQLVQLMQSAHELHFAVLMLTAIQGLACMDKTALENWRGSCGLYCAVGILGDVLFLEGAKKLS
jgi:hypothetical protein